MGRQSGCTTYGRRTSGDLRSTIDGVNQNDSVARRRDYTYLRLLHEPLRGYYVAWTRRHAPPGARRRPVDVRRVRLERRDGLDVHDYSTEL